ncbi:hypothetical protein [Enterococcus diestrammenae]|uniref:Peptidase S74 domain-containing protein n=1 Tax=Enterococcus diestrammenae TaxID=1155073 RepID=A0ABV0F621_9ENTE|nr:hypothetical protein [Enterococcus diestrammenae]KAF1296522.1 hypothetical protein BAU18_11990 [Enterococcus diestrammenae]
MLATSEAVLAAWLSPARQLAVRVQVDQSSYGSEDVTSLSFDSGSISGEVYQIGSTYMNTVQIVFPSIIETIKEDQEVIPELGILVDGEYHYSKLGHFFITEFNRDRNAKTTTITASDKMIYMEGVYESKLTYSKPYREVALEIANLAGVEVNQDSFASLGTGAIKKPVGYTFRQAIGLIAQFEGGFASFNRDGELEIRRLRPTEFEVTPESYLLKGFSKNENAYRIGGITVRIGEEETDVLRVGSTNGSQIELENKVMTQTLLNNIWDLVKNLNYFPFELKWRGCPLLEAGDWMYVTDRDGNRYSVPNLSYSLTFNGGLSGESKATTNSSSQSTYKYRGSLKQKVDWLDSILSANNWNSNYYDATEPSAPKEGDAWFKPNGRDIEIWVYEKDAEGNLDWVFKISTATDPALIALIEENKRLVEEAQAAAEDAQKAGEDAQKVADEAKGLADQAGVDAGQALDKANDAVSKANDATAKVGGLETAVGLVTEQSANAVDVANQAKSNADTALGKADSAIGTAQDALNQSALAKSQAEEAIEKYLGMGMVPAWSWSADGTDRFTTVYPNENLFKMASLYNGFGRIIEENTVTYPDGIWAQLVVNNEEIKTMLKPNTTYSVQYIFELLSRTEGTKAYNQNQHGSLLLYSGVSGNISIDLGNVWYYPGGNVNDAQTWTVGTARKRESTFTTPSTLHDSTANYRIVGYTLRSVDESNKLVCLESGKFYDIKFEENPTPTIYTPPPSEDYANAVPSYIGFAIEPSDNPADYTWIRNPEKVEGEVKVELTDINGELSWKVSQETFDQLNSTVINHSTLISQNQNAIKLKADQSTVDTINQTVAEHSTAIDLNAEAIALKANQSTVDSLTGRVTEAEGSITTIAGQVALKANQSVVDTLTNTVNAHSSELTVQAGKISGLTTVTDGHTTKIGALELQAGQFSLSLSDVRNDVNGVNTSNNLLSGFTFSNNKDVNITTGEVGAGWRTIVDDYVPVLPNTKYTFSRPEKIKNMGFRGYNTDKSYIGAVANTAGSERITNFTTPYNCYFIKFIDESNKLTKGYSLQVALATVTEMTAIRATVNSLTMTVADKADKTTVTQLANQWQQTTDLANGHTSQISSLGDAINLRVEKDDIINQININEQGVLIAGEKVHITGLTTIDDAVIKTANIVDLNVTEAKLGNLSVSTAKIKDAAITSAKIDTAAIGTAHIGDGVITTAKIGDAQITGAKIHDATISNAKIISLDANKIVANTLSAITTNTGALNVSGWLTMSTDNKGILGSYDFGDAYGQAFNYRWFVGDYRISHRHMVFTGKAYNVTTSDTRGSYLYDVEAYYGNDYIKLRQYNSAGTLLNRIDVNSDAITMGAGDWGTASNIVINSDGTSYFNGRGRFAGLDVSSPNGLGIRVQYIDAPAGLNYLAFNQNKALTDAVFGIDNIYFNQNRTGAADFRIGKDGSSINGGRVVSSSAVYNRTYSGAANMIVTESGTLGRTTSARKYKADIQVADNVVANAKKVLSINPSSWWDKGELADGVAKERYYGFIADEFDEVGLNEVVVYRDGEIESLAYDRISMYHNVILSEHEKEILALKAKVQQLENEIRVLRAA